jgi:hypothetical protein
MHNTEGLLQYGFQYETIATAACPAFAEKLNNNEVAESNKTNPWANYPANSIQEHGLFDFETLCFSNSFELFTGDDLCQIQSGPLDWDPNSVGPSNEEQTHLP